MSYAPPPGFRSTSSPHPSLPARPPPSAHPPTSFPSNNASRAPSFGSFGGFAPRQVAAPQPGYATQPSPYQQQGFDSSYSRQQQSNPAYGGIPQIQNPFTQNATGYQEEDPEMAAQIAQWQSAYTGNTTSSTGYTGVVRKSNAGEGGTSANVGGSSTAMSNAPRDSGVAAIVSDAKTNQKTVVRSGGGKKWSDDSLLEWDPAHFRLFVGNLAGEVTDESLHKAFNRWTSIQKARVIRDKRTTKSKGYGFVSFSDGDDFFQAAREMQGKYIGSHPVLLSKSKTEIKAVTPKDKNKKNKGKGGNNKDRDKTGAGVQKVGSKTKGGLRVLG